MSRRQRIDSITAQVEVVQAASLELVPPEHIPLKESDLPFWRSVIAEKPKTEWTGHDLEIAALLAMSMRKMGEQDVLLDTEGPLVTTVGGNLAQNPRCRVVADLHARVIKYRQTLGIHNRGKNGEQRDVNKRREATKVIEDAATGFGDEDDLIARPTAH